MPACTVEDGNELVRFKYYSKVNPGITQTDLTNILTTARTFNAKHSLTGVLCFDEQFFLQVLEGPRNKIDMLIQRLIRDGRHSDFNIITMDPIRSRMFGLWHMASVNAEDIINNGKCRQFFGEDSFVPAHMPVEKAHEFAIMVLLPSIKI